MSERVATVDEYLESLEPRRRAALERLRNLVHEEVPGVSETMQYGMPYYEHNGMLCAFASQKKYASFYVMNGEVVDQHRHLLNGFSVGKGCIRVKDGSELPEEVVRTLLRTAVEANEKQYNDHC